MKSWTGPESDMISTYLYWLKKLTVIHGCLAAHMSKLLAPGTQPEWLTLGRKTLIMKNPHKGTAPCSSGR